MTLEVSEEGRRLASVSRAISQRGRVRKRGEARRGEVDRSGLATHTVGIPQRKSGT